MEEYALKNDVPSISRLSDHVKVALDKIKTYLLTEGSIIVFCEGDSLLASSEEQVMLPMDLLIHDQISFSAGVGRSTAMALLALKKAKGLGKRRVEIFMGELT